VKGLLPTLSPEPRERRRVRHPRRRGAGMPTRRWQGPALVSSASIGTLAVGTSLLPLIGLEGRAVGWLLASGIAAALALQGLLPNIRHARPVHVD
jgi:hypothetical protein